MAELEAVGEPEASEPRDSCTGAGGRSPYWLWKGQRGLGRVSPRSWAGWSWQEADLVSGTAVRMEFPYPVPPAPPAPEACFPTWALPTAEAPFS